MQCQLIFYCDLDGVLTDFENHLLKEIPQVLPPSPIWAHMPAFDSIAELRQHLGSDWYKMTANLPESFWEFMPWLSDGGLLWDFLSHILDPWFEPLWRFGGSTSNRLEPWSVLGTLGSNRFEFQVRTGSRGSNRLPESCPET